MSEANRARKMNIPYFTPPQPAKKQLDIYRHSSII